MTVITAVLLAATLTGAAIDVRTRRIPNVLTGAVALAALLIHATQGVVPLLLAIAAMCGAFALGAVAFSAGWFGGGDVKLIAACCGVAGLPGAVTLALFILLCGGLLALVTAALQGRLVALVRSTAGVAVRRAPVEGTALPYGVAIAAGALAYVATTTLFALRLPV